MNGTMKGRAATLIATWFGCGYAPKGPGTAGSIAALAIAWLLVMYAGWGAGHFALLSLAALFPAIWAASETAARLQLKDPGVIVVDEVLGQWIALAGARPMNWKSMLAALALFRLFDIWKPQPVRALESLPGGTGIVMDDVAAGMYAALVLFFAGCFNLY
uniref:Phosphatidylglycerophosphatase n=1 Tax=uncultured bacterium 89 TaxID=698393 RepID=E3T699_9BACT|nr:phosphatidylglycerophosphatase [uncultured bacterium 89]